MPVSCTPHSNSFILKLLAVTTAVAVIATGCDDRIASPDELSHTAVIEASSAVQSEQVDTDFDAHWAEVSEIEVPGFAGFWRDSNGRYVVGLTKPENAAMAAEYVRNRTGSRIHIPDVVIQQVTYRFSELYRWKQILLSRVDGERVFWLDIDEVNNALTFGVGSESYGGDLITAARSAAIPENAVRFVITEAPVERISLSDRIRPVVGGVVTTFLKSGQTGSCTLGFNATKGLDRVFVTAAHCSSQKFATDGTVHNQAYAPDGIGVEILDPTAGLYRWSDAALYRYDSGIAVDWGHIARTTYPSVNSPGSTTIDAAYPRFRVTAEATNASQVVGALANKMGAVSGWTQGQVLRTCVALSGMPCQWEARVWSEHGDSGSPIFQQNGPFEPEASQITLWGVLWGGPPGDWTTTWYSPISAVKSELGSLNIVCNPAASTCYAPVVAVINGLRTIRQQGYYTYSVSAAHGDGSYTYAWQVCNESGTGCINKGTGSSISLYFSSGDPAVTVRCTVSSAGQQTTAEMIVYVMF